MGDHTLETDERESAERAVLYKSIREHRINAQRGEQRERGRGKEIQEGVERGTRAQDREARARHKRGAQQGHDAASLRE